jgi:hypothetical protein
MVDRAGIPGLDPPFLFPQISTLPDIFTTDIEKPKIYGSPFEAGYFYHGY